jgi:glycerol-3-phosphate dehydrogenase
MRFVRTVDIVTRPLTRENHGFAFFGPQPGRPQTMMRYFMAPWRGYSVVGSVDYMAGTDPDAFGVSEAELQELLLAVRLAMPGAKLGMDDIVAVQAGLIPHEDTEPLDDPYNAARHYRIVDHERVDGTRGLISVVGIKYTTARDVAEKTVDKALRKLGMSRVPSRSAEHPLHCGDIGDVEAFLAAAERAARDGIDPAIPRALARLYGSKYPEIVSLASAKPLQVRTLPGRQAVLRAQVVYAVRREMALTLSDVVVRRTPLATDGHPGKEALADCAEIMAAELGWDASRTSREIAETEAYLKRFWTKAASGA